MMKRLSAPLALLVLVHVLGTAAFSIQSTSTARSSRVQSSRSQGQLQLLTSPPSLVVHTFKSKGIATSRTLVSPLFSASASSQQQQQLQKPGKQPLRSLFRRVLLARSATISVVAKKFRRSLTLLLTVSFLWLGVAGFSTLPSHAATAAASSSTSNIPVVERLTRGLTQAVSPSLDTMVDRYVKDHMFDDDVYDPVESIYREANDDAVVGKYPAALREIAVGALGKQTDGGLSGDRSDATAGASIASALTGAIAALQKRLGLSQQAAILVLAGTFVVAGPMMGLFGMMMIGGVSKRNMNKVMKQRYGDTYTVDATSKPEEEVEAPDDEDDDDDDDDDEDDDDDDDDDKNKDDDDDDDDDE